MTARWVYCAVLISIGLSSTPVSATDPRAGEPVLIADEALDSLTAGAIFVDSFADARAFGPFATTFTSNFIQTYSLPNYQFGSVNSAAWGAGQMVQVQTSANAFAGPPSTTAPTGFPVSASAVSNVYLFIFGPGR